MSTLAELEAKVDALDQQVTRALADQLTPNYLTVNPDGTVSADFTGIVHALGLEITERDGAAGYQFDNAITFARIDGATDPFGNPPGYIGASNVTGAEGDVLAIAASAVPPNTGALTQLLAGKSSGAFPSASVTAQVGQPGVGPVTNPDGVYATVNPLPGGGRKTIIDANGDSDFVQMATTDKLAISGPYVFDMTVPPNSWGSSTFALGTEFDTYAVPIGGIEGQPFTPAFWSFAGVGSPISEMTIYVANNSGGTSGYQWAGFVIGIPV